MLNLLVQIIIHILICVDIDYCSENARIKIRHMQQYAAHMSSRTSIWTLSTSSQSLINRAGLIYIIQQRRSNFFYFFVWYWYPNEMARSALSNARSVNEKCGKKINRSAYLTSVMLFMKHSSYTCGCC